MKNERRCKFDGVWVLKVQFLVRFLETSSRTYRTLKKEREQRTANSGCYEERERGREGERERERERVMASAETVR